MEVDHYDPSKKNDVVQKYQNLLLASRHCNGAKRDKPTKAELKLGLRFLNPCEEWDYGEHIFEDSTTHRLVGVTPIGKYHIRFCDLNAGHLIQERKDRSEILSTLRRSRITIKKERQYGSTQELITALKKEVEKMIPELPLLPMEFIPTTGLSDVVASRSEA